MSDLCVKCGRAHPPAMPCSRVPDEARKAEMLAAAEKLSSGVHIVYGWRIPESAVLKTMMDFSPEAHELGIRIVLPANRKDGVAGIPLGVIRTAAEERIMGALLPDTKDDDKLRAGMGMLGLADIAGATEPGLWLVDDRR